MCVLIHIIHGRRVHFSDMVCVCVCASAIICMEFSLGLYSDDSIYVIYEIQYHLKLLIEA